MRERKVKGFINQYLSLNREIEQLKHAIYEIDDGGSLGSILLEKEKKQREFELTKLENMKVYIKEEEENV